MQAYYHTRSTPSCPVCGGRHYPGTNGAGRRVHCDGTPAETRAEQLAREQEQLARAAVAEQDEREERSARARKGAETRRRKQERARARLTIQAEHASRADAPPIDATDIGRIPDTF